MTNNVLILISSLSWLAAQLIKSLGYRLKYKTWDYKKLIESGGMPSSHCAFVCSLTYGLACKYGINSDFFSIALAFTLVVMYDAMGVRNEAGKHAKIINDMQKEMQMSEEIHLKESLGHRPLEVLSGAALGIGISAIAQLV
ncbi:MAG TPA: divergent PAP2 family protein [Caproiciproducens sp.]|nr:divergent PAP2 family protein [Caproiciproducens sp.]